ncbi:MAG TPA: RNA pseudouridine synthase [Firmicutes bacterium]|jgi:23S rRNA pseudouridine1911/1915/1917 synthase|nr:RNA pseudouridine synthase [Bacillota bacterium]
MMEEKIRIEVENLEKNERIDKYLSSKLDDSFSRAKIQKLIDEELILVNDKVIKSSYKVSNGDVILITDKEEDMSVKPEKMDIDIVYEDDDVMVINKKSGVVVHPAPGNYSGTLVNGLMYLSKDLSHVNGEFRPGIVHRIDKDTSGLLIVAKNDKAHRILAEELKEKKIKRKYIALVSGVINHDIGEIDAPIGRDPSDRKKMCVTSTNSKDAITHFRVLERYKNASLIECELETGRTHQIRVHMKYINHPVINDPVYGKNNHGEFGQLLHAKEITFTHPTTKEVMTFSCEVPEEFNKILEEYKEE